MNWITAFKVMLMGAGALIGGLLGGFDMGIQFLFWAVLFDYVTGIIAAGYEGKISSKIAFKCIPKKLLIFVMVALAVQVDKFLGLNDMTRMATIIYYIGMEGISILENTARAGLPVPNVLKKALQQLKEQDDK